MALMDSKALPIFIFFNIIFTTFVTSHNVAPCPPQANNEFGKCPKDTLKFGVCGSWLGLVHEVVGTPPSDQCCTLVKGLADIEAAACLCTAIKAHVLGIVKVEVPVALSLLVNACGKKVPQGFICA